MTATSSRQLRGPALPAALTLAALLALLCSCSNGDGRPDREPDVAAGPRPQTPSVYMEVVTDRWNILTRDGARVWRPVVQNGRRWTGDARVYEKVCGATFLDKDGLVPSFYDDAPDGKTWYDALRADPRRWAAFNAWLADPAVQTATKDTTENVKAGRGQLGDRSVVDYGDVTGCPNRSDAGTPVS